MLVPDSGGAIDGRDESLAGGLVRGDGGELELAATMNSTAAKLKARLRAEHAEGGGEWWRCVHAMPCTKSWG